MLRLGPWLTRRRERQTTNAVRTLAAQQRAGARPRQSLYAVPENRANSTASRRQTRRNQAAAAEAALDRRLNAQEVLRHRRRPMSLFQRALLNYSHTLYAHQSRERQLKARNVEREERLREQNRERAIGMYAQLRRMQALMPRSLRRNVPPPPPVTARRRPARR